MSPAALFVVFVITLFLSIPVSSAVTLTSLFPGFFTSIYTVSSFVRYCIEGVNSFTLLAIPMFILSGIIMARGGVSKKLFEFFEYFLGKIPGGMPCAVVITCLFYGAISGSAPATVAAVGSMTIPVLLNLGYKREFTVSTVAVAGSLGVIIPPSIPMVLYCMANSDASVGSMFTTGIIPGFLIAGCLCVYAVFYCIKNGEDKEKINKEVGALHERGFVKVFTTSFWALLSPVIILGSIYGGIASPTEAATISVFYALIVGLFIYRTLKPKDIWPIIRESVETYAPLLFVLGSAAAFAKIIAIMQIPTIISTFMTTTFHSKFAILLIVNIILFFVGMVMDGGPAILLLTPILWPIVEAVGMNEIHFGINMVVNLAIGFVTPPIGINLFVASRVGELPVMTVARNVMPYIALFIVALILIVVFPQISLCLL
ncbi:MAG: TRAP transporter large permease [Lachnospiraceae bacterium]|nr:TRAP transporter large permease [Lachnospiraceae bacterium]